ncbi:hypothetical protein [Swingsia samuiensis]|uniref:Uncharacterized protein n=1 Tax=Swingsia samuiensis TaxID=1293412 RepID=A0A4Y6UHT4_9PROT|nr:hypothetical protein [Swingsia samuiensis]QDH17159.1 hypothetical protein E3D00_05960 [Swingsia samuiensis]
MTFAFYTYSPFLFLGLISGLSLCGLGIKLLPYSSTRLLGLLLLFSSPLMAFFFPFWHQNGINITRTQFAFFQGIFISPTIIFPLGATLLQLPAGTNRTAKSLGANFYTRLRLIWIPVLFPSAFLSLFIAFAFSFICIILDRP